MNHLSAAEAFIGAMVWQGDNLFIQTTGHHGSCPVMSFIESLPEKDQSKLYRLFRKIDVMKGNFRNPEQYKELGVEVLGRKVFEIKSFQIRIGCFWDAGNLYLAHAFIKKQDKWPQRDVDKLKKACWAFLEGTKKGGSK